MSLLDDARRILADSQPYVPTDEGDFCSLCDGAIDRDGIGHEHDCPWLSMPKIVKALEEAERVITDWECGDEASRIGGWRLPISLPDLKSALQGDEYEGKL